jgi:hypothetical protein
LGEGDLGEGGWEAGSAAGVEVMLVDALLLSFQNNMRSHSAMAASLMVIQEA